jgi:hypothetical protein
MSYPTPTPPPKRPTFAAMLVRAQRRFAASRPLPPQRPLQPATA